MSILEKQSVKVMARNREAYHEYFVEEEFEAGIELVGTEVIGGAMLTVAIKGEIGAVRTAVDAGAAAAKQAGKLHCANVIARPSTDAAKILNLNMAD